MGQHTANKNWAPYESTTEERPQKGKRHLAPIVSKVEVVMTLYHLMDSKQDIVIAGGGLWSLSCLVQRG